MAQKKKLIRNIRPNAGVEAKYRKQLKMLIVEMTNSATYWIKAAYNKENPLLVFDASPVVNIKKMLNALRKRWERNFNKQAKKIASLYTKSILKTSDGALKEALKEAGLSVQFVLTPLMRDNLNAVMTENITLIKSIPAQYLQQIEGIVMRSYTAGRDLETMTNEIKRAGGVSMRRAELIARDQSNKANATVIRTRQLELGITEGIWCHSRAGREPRPSHVAANGRKFKLAEGCLIDGEHILPGEEINCRCTWRGVLPT